MSTINGITVRISDGVKTADYAPPRLYDLTANITPGEDPEADALATVQLLQRVGEAYLGRATATVTAAEVPAAPAADKGKGKGKKADATIEPPSVLHEEDVKAHIAENKPDPAAISLPGVPDAPKPEAPKAESLVTAEDLSDLVSQPEISDAALNTAVTRRLKELGATGPNLVRALKDSYNPEPDKRVLQIRELDQGQRATFLARLDKLSAAMSVEEAAAIEA